MAGRVWPTRGADVWPDATRTGGHADAREGRHVASKVGKWRAHGLVGPGKYLGAVTQ